MSDLQRPQARKSQGSLPSLGQSMSIDQWVAHAFVRGSCSGA